MATKKKKTKAADSTEAKETKKKAKKKVEKKEVAADGTGEKKKVKRKARAKKEFIPDRFRLYWGVFNHALKRVAMFEFNQRKAAEKRAEELSEGGKPPHFVQKVKEVIQVDPAADV
jgi:hypothetical protein